MFKLLGIVLAIILTSFAIFPIELVWFPGLTLKTAMAPLGLVMLLVKFSSSETFCLRFWILIGWHLGCSSFFY